MFPLFSNSCIDQLYLPFLLNSYTLLIIGIFFKKLLINLVKCFRGVRPERTL